MEVEGKDSMKASWKLASWSASTPTAFGRCRLLADVEAMADDDEAIDAERELATDGRARLSEAEGGAERLGARIGVDWLCCMQVSDS